MFEAIDGTYVLVAVVLAFALLGVVAVQTTVMVLQQADATGGGCSPGSVGFNASKGRCYHP